MGDSNNRYLLSPLSVGKAKSLEKKSALSDHKSVKPRKRVAFIPQKK